MKKIFSFLSAGLLLMMVSCNTTADNAVETSDDLMYEKNIGAFNTVSKAFETGDVSGIDSVIADDYVDHTERGDIRGRDSLKAMITQMHEVMKDSKMETINTVAKDDYVYGWMRYSGTSNGEMGMPKGPYDMQAIEVVKFNNDGKATEHWAFMETQDMMKMMAPPSP